MVNALNSNANIEKETRINWDRRNVTIKTTTNSTNESKVIPSLSSNLTAHPLSSIMTILFSFFIIEDTSSPAS